MKTSVNFYDFDRAFEVVGRKDQFTYAGKRAMFEYLEELEDGTGEEIELDVIALCCEYVEYDNLAEFHGEYDKEEYPDLETLRDHTQVIEIEEDGAFIIAAF